MHKTGTFPTKRCEKYRYVQQEKKQKLVDGRIQAMIWLDKPSQFQHP